ncbi:MAG TPA: flagellar export chaperone FliS [Longimicrobiaceae bacterium]|nr:flagellar export chaperone FliS [Longimicrobiaceae bacterium]
MTYGSQSSAYLENEVLSRAPEWLIPLLYEHLVANLTRAAVQIEIGEKTGSATSLDKASTIVFELLRTLDLERGGEIAENLSSLYSYYAGEIIRVGTSSDAERLQKIIDWATELHESWTAAAEIVAPRNGGSSTRATALA